MVIKRSRSTCNSSVLAAAKAEYARMHQQWVKCGVSPPNCEGLGQDFFYFFYLNLEMACMLHSALLFINFM